MKIVYITGCLGFMGSHLTEECLKLGWKVYGVDNCSYAANLEMIDEFNKYQNFKFIKSDICDLNYLNDCDYVINTAAESHVANSIVDNDVFVKTNILGVKRLLDLVKSKQRGAVDSPIFFHFSTDEVYGDIVSGQFTENDLLHPSNPYSASKAAADMLVLAWARTYDLKYVILRPTNNYGIRQYQEKLIPIIVRNINWGKKIKLHDEGEPIRTWLHAHDTAMGVIKIIESGACNEIFNISGGFEQKNIETVKQVVHHYFEGKENYNLEEFLDRTYKRPGQDVRYSIDDSKLRNLGWEPKKVFSEEIGSIVAYYKEYLKW